MPVGYTPIYKLFKDNLDITDRFNDRTTEIQISLVSGGGDSDKCSISIDDRDWKLARPDVGSRIAIYLGYKEIGYADQGTFEINTVEFLGPARTLKLVGTAVGFMNALKAPEIKSHDGKTLGDILGEIARKGGAELAISPDLANEKVPFFNQSMSSLHMLHELERRFGAIGKFERGKLVFKHRGDGLSASGENQPLLVLEPENFGTWSVRHTERTSYAKARVSYLDPTSKMTKWVEEANPGASQLAEGLRDTVFPYGKQMKSEAEAKAMAKSIMDSLRRQRVEANFTLAKGDPWIRDEMPILVRNMRDGVNGSYVSDTVSHIFTKGSGIGTTIMAKAPSAEADFPMAASDSPLSLDQLFPGQTIDSTGTTIGI